MSRFHPEAVKAYNNKATDVLAAVEPMPPVPQRPTVPPEKSDAPVTGHFGPGQINIESYREFRLDQTGERVACYFHVEGRGLVGISGTAHETIVDLTTRLATDQAYRNQTSEEFVYGAAVDWLQASAAGRSTTSIIEHIESSAAAAIKNREIWIPFPIIQIPHPIEIGPVTFRRVTKPMMDEYAEKIGAYSTPAGAAGFDRLRTRIQTATAACLTVYAEPIKAQQIAAQEADPAISILRLACPVLLDVYQWAPIDPSFLDSMGGTMFLRIENKKIEGFQSSLPVRMRAQWVFTPEDVQHNMRWIWGFGHNLLVINRNEFQELLLGALVHFSKSVLKPDTSERLMYVVTALEALFVREGEPILQNLRERMAMMQGPDPAERLKAVENITKIYDLRSKFVHRAVLVSDMRVLADFFVEAWSAIFFLLNNYNKWATKTAFLDFVDSYKFRGPEFDTSNLPLIPDR